MKNSVQFRSRLAFGGEILAQQATFLPVAPDQSSPERWIYLSERRHSGGFLPVFNPHGKKMIVAQPLLREVLR
jgi:hypothetical protein